MPARGVDGLALGAIGAGALFAYAALKGKTILGQVQALIKGTGPASAPAANPITGTSSADLAALGVTDTGNAIPGSPGSPGSGGPGGGGGTPVANTGSVQSILQQTAAKFGWGSGAQWQALQNIEMHEAGYDPHIKNSSSGAYGIAQAYGHGTAADAGTESDMYGGYGLSHAQAKLANSGDAAMQALWMCNYISATYGTPGAAWAQYFNHPGGVGSY